MSQTPDEIPLDEGGLEPGRVVRVGNTVRRPAGPWTPSCHHLMRFLHGQGLDFVPDPLGIDEQGRDTITYIPGRGHGWPFISEIMELDGVAALGGTATRLRRALNTYVCPADATWQFTTGRPPEGQSLQHGDLGPWNILWDSGPDPVGVIDWDMVDLGNQFYDTGMLAWFIVPFMNDDRAQTRGFPHSPDRANRLAAFAAGAGMDQRLIIKHGLAAQKEFARRICTRRHLHNGHTIWATVFDRGLDKAADRDQEWTVGEFLPNLSM